MAAGAPASTDCIISVPIRMERELKIVPVFKNVPEGFDVTNLKYTLSQDTIRLEGDIDVMKKFSEEGVFSLDGIDLSTLTPSNRKFTIKLAFSSAVTSLNGESEIVVTFDMSGYKQDTFTVGSDRIVLTNADGHNVTVASESLEVSVVGRSSIIDRLNDNNIMVIVNMSGDEWTPGVREKSAQVLVSNNNRCWAVGTYTVKIKVE